MKTKKIKDISKTLLSLLLGIAIMWWLYRETDMSNLWAIMKSANFGIIAFSLLFGILGNYLRGLRWELFINSLGYTPKRASIVYATFGNYAVNFLLPRAGDLWRCGIVTKYDKIPFSKTLETFLVDKVLDLIAGISIIIGCFAFSLDFVVEYFSQNQGFAENIKSMIASMWLYVCVGIVIVAAILLFTIFKENRLVKRLKHMLSTIKYDLKLIAKMKSKHLVIGYTIAIWICFYLYFYICFFAFDFTSDLGLIVALIIFAMSNIGVSVPVQGGIGAWHFMVISSLVIFGVTKDQASAFAGAVFTIQSVWIILVGVFGILALPYVKRDKQNLGNNSDIEL